MIDLDDLLDFAAPWLRWIAFASIALLVLGPAFMAMVYKDQRDAARAEIEIREVEVRAMRQRLVLADSEIDRKTRELKEFQQWVATNPAPKDPEKLRVWLLQVGRR